MRLSTRYGLVGIGALSLLSLIHWLRGSTAPRQPVLNYFLDVGPNFGAAVAITFVLLGIWADQNRETTFTAALRAFLVCASISGLGLLGWEFVQKTSSRFVFDPHDAGATLVGVGTAGIVFISLTRRERAKI